MRVQTIDLRSIASLLAALMLLAGAAAEGQQRNLRGIVTDTAGYPLPNVEIRIMDLGRMARTDVGGRFAITGISSRIVDLTLRRLGYEVRFVRVSMINGEGDSLRVSMRPEPLRLAQVEIEEKEERHPFFSEYEKRRERGIGTFITEKDISRLNTSYPSDAFRRLPGMLVTGGNVRFMSKIGMTGGRSGAGSSACVPTIWMDGQAVLGMEIDEVRAQDIHGIEIYRGAATVPTQFAKAGLTQCGAIVVWTKRKTK